MVGKFVKISNIFNSDLQITNENIEFFLCTIMSNLLRENNIFLKNNLQHHN